MFFLEHYEVWKNGTMAPSGRANQSRQLFVNKAVLRRAASRPYRRHHHDVRYRNDVADLELARTDDRQRRRLHPADADHVASAPTERHRRGAGERQRL